MMEFGKELKAARELKGLTCSQVAEKTHLMTQVVEGLEAENFKKIVAPIYGRGFVKLYCEAVGLDAKAYVDEFMRLYSVGKTPAERGEKVPAPSAESSSISSERVVSSAPAAEVPRVSEPIPAPALEPERAPVAPVAAELPLESLLSSQPTTVHSSIPSSLSHEPTPSPSLQQPKVEQPKSAAPKTSRYSDPLFDPPPFSEEKPAKPKRTFHMPSMDLPDVPPSLWRMASLVVVILLIIWGLVIGVRALYRATMTAPAKDTPTQEVASRVSKVEEPAAKPAVTEMKGPRKPMNIPALYID